MRRRIDGSAAIAASLTSALQGAGAWALSNARCPRISAVMYALHDDQGEWCMPSAITKSALNPDMRQMAISESAILYYAVATPDNWDAILEELA